MEATAPYAISATDRSGLIVITETLFMSWMVLVSLIRLYMRLTMNGPVQLDDVVIFIGSVIGIAHVGTIMDSVSHGLGKSQDDISSLDLKRAAEGLYGANLLFLTGHGAAKISVCLLLRRLGRQKGYLLGCKIALVMVACWTVASFFAAAFSCLPRYQWVVAQHCRNIASAWKAITAFDVITEVVAFALSIYLVWDIQMRWKRKSAVIFAFGTRLSIIVLIILRQTYLNQSLFQANAPLHLSNAVITTGVLLHCSIMVSTVPCLKPFVVAFNTGWGQGVVSSNGNSYFTPTGKNTSTAQSQAFAGAQQEEDEVKLANSRPSHESQHSQHLIIHQTREWTVEEEFELRSMKDRI